MKAAALLALLAALPGHASETVTPAQARSNVVAALPPEIARGAGQGDLRAYLERLGPEQKQAAIRSLTAKEGELADDPTTLGVIGEAYAGLGKVQEARQAARAILDRNPNDPAAKRLMVWVATQEHLPGRDGGVGSPAGGRPAAGTFAPAAGGRRSVGNDISADVARAFRRGQGSAEFQDTMQDAGGMSVAELNAAGISFKHADPGQKEPVMIIPQGKGFTVSLRDDAFASGGDAEARAAANVANGVRQAQTKREHPLIGGALLWARGWFTGATVHKELAPTDIEARPTVPAAQELMAARKLLDQKANQFVPGQESYGTTADQYLPMMNNFSKILPVDKLFERYAESTGHGGS